MAVMGVDVEGEVMLSTIDGQAYASRVDDECIIKGDSSVPLEVDGLHLQKCALAARNVARKLVVGWNDKDWRTSRVAVVSSRRVPGWYVSVSFERDVQAVAFGSLTIVVTRSGDLGRLKFTEKYR